jgi:chaperonin GroEL (HSP60 family)
VEGLLRDGAAAEGSEGPRTWRDAQRDAAAFVVDLCAGGYGPHGAAKLVVAADGQARWVRSAAVALRECAVGPMLAPYADLAARVHRHSGDQTTAAVLLAARLVAKALADAAPPTPAWIEGYRLAARQARAWLSASTRPSPAAEALSSVAARDWADAVTVGLARLAGDGGEADLDTVDVRAEPDGPAWLEGTLVAPQEIRAESAGPVRLLLLDGGWSAKPKTDGLQAVARDPHGLAAFAGAEAARRARVVRLLGRLGVRFLACSAGVDDDLAGALRAAGVTVWTDAPKPAIDRMARSTGARRIARLEDAVAADVGRGDLARRPRRGWLLAGEGPSATFTVPALASGPARDAAVEQGERLLRAAGLALAKPGALPGGGRWQRGLAASLRAAADAAPGHAPVAVRAAADAVEALAEDLLRNAGLDVLSGGLPPGSGSVHDAAACVRLAVDGAFETAIAALRLDGAYARRPSTAVGLRGGTGKAGSPKGMPGDLPPLM